jgi:hypothetical protein
VTIVDRIAFSGLTIGTLLKVWGFIIALLDRLEQAHNSKSDHNCFIYHHRTSFIIPSLYSRTPTTRQRPAPRALAPPDGRAPPSPEHHELAPQPSSPLEPLTPLPPAVDGSDLLRSVLEGIRGCNQRDSHHALTSTRYPPPRPPPHAHSCWRKHSSTRLPRCRTAVRLTYPRNEPPCRARII